MGCYFLLQGIFLTQRLNPSLLQVDSSITGRFFTNWATREALKSESVSHSAVSDSQWPHRLWLTRLLCPWKSLGKNTGVGGHFLLQGIFLTQGSNPYPLVCCIAAAAAAKSLQSCPTLWPHIRQPTRLPGPWDLPGKKTSGLPFSSPRDESEKWKWSCSVVSDPQQRHGLQPTRLLRPWDFPGRSTGVGCHCLLRIHPLKWCKKVSKCLPLRCLLRTKGKGSNYRGTLQIPT